MKRFITVLMISGCALFFAVPLFAEMPGPDPAALWHHITVESPYRQWQFWPDHQGMQPGMAPHGPRHKVYVNDRAVKANSPPVQYGSIVVKENYSNNNELKAITVMYKIEGYNPDANDWFWGKYTPQGTADKYGMPKGCIGCHGTRANNDFIMVHEFK